MSWGGVKPKATFTINTMLPAWAQWRKRDVKGTNVGAGGTTPDTAGDAAGNAVETDDADDLTSPKGGAWGSEKSAALDALAFATAGQVLGDGMSDALIQMELLEVEGEGEASRQDSGHSVNSTFVELRPEDSWSTRMVPPGRICHICKGVFDTFGTVSEQFRNSFSCTRSPQFQLYTSSVSPLGLLHLHLLPLTHTHTHAHAWLPFPFPIPLPL